MLITGDIANSKTIINILRELSSALPKQSIYFVLGNHDFYDTSIASIRNEVSEFCKTINNLHYLTTSSPVPTSIQNVYLAGTDGWYDARNGDYDSSPIILNDFIYIDELREAYQTSRIALKLCLESLADDYAKDLDRKLNQIESGIVLTRVPPFPEISLYNGKISNSSCLPFFSSKAIGDILLKHSGKKLLVLCGHRHHEAEYRVGNMLMRCCKAEYNSPDFTIIDIDKDFIFV